MKTLFPVIFLCFFGFFLKAQTNLDSLYSVWQDESRSDSDRTGAYKSYIWDGFLFSNPDTAILLIQPLLRYGEEQQYEKAIAMAYNLMGISNFVKADIAKSLDFYQLGLKVSEEIGDKKGSADIISNIGMTYDNLGDYPKALEYYRRSLKFFEETEIKRAVQMPLI
jgi:adenylate cyclase